MNGRKVLIGAAAAALTVNALVVVDALTLGLLAPRAEAKGTVAERARPAGQATPAAPAEAGAGEAEAAYRVLVAELQQQKQALDRRTGELAARERQLEALQRSLEADAAERTAGGAAGRGGSAGAAATPAPRAAFDRLLKAYEGMDPENAAAALAEIYKKERQVVVEVLLGMKPRQAAAVLDALAATAPSIAAELSLEVWRRDR
jgi:flagellar motility protein MotE (MotC chaperone)